MRMWLALYLLVVLDGTIAGYRDALGRHPGHTKGRFYAEASARGALLAHVALVPIIALGLIALGLSGTFGLDAAQVYQTARFFAAQMAFVYGLYAALIALGLSLYVLPPIELRSYITIGLFGMLTLARPLVIASGLLIAILSARALPGVELVAFVALIAAWIVASFDAIHRRLGWNASKWGELD